MGSVSDDDRPAAAALLTKSQQGGLAAGLRVVEQELLWIERVLERPLRGELVSFVDDLDENARRELRRGLGRCAAILAEARTHFGLASERIVETRWLTARLLYLGIVAEECRSPHLRGFGELRPDAAVDVDRLVGPLVEALNGMHQAVLRVGPGDAR